MISGKKCLIILILGIYILVGIFLVKDYNISSDEPNERLSMYVNLNYVLTRFGKESMAVPELDSYSEKYYGIFCQMPTVLCEVGHKGSQHIYYWRHVYTFGFCLLGYIAFFFLCKRLFASNLMGVLGAAMIALYPRFFAEQFYNIKDMFFVSVFMIAMWATVKLLDSRFSWGWAIIFSFISAVATNVRIVGIIFIIFVIGYLWTVFVTEKAYRSVYYNLTLKKSIILTALFMGLYLLFLIIITPVAWENPIHNIVEMFIQFSDYNDWTGAIIFMGKNWGKDGLPWYYVPVWMLVSVPVWYFILVAVTGCLCIKKGIILIKEKQNLILNIIYNYKYVIWCLLLMGVPELGIILNHATLYGGWRHCYFMVPPFVLLSLFGINYFRKQRNLYTILIGILIVLGMGIQLRWIIINHPHEMVYFNNIGKRWAAGFDRDYWHLGELQAYKYISENDKSNKITINTSGTKSFLFLLDEDERNRVEIVDDPMYYIETYRGRIGNEFEMEGYEEFYSIVVDGFKVTTVMKKVN